MYTTGQEGMNIQNCQPPQRKVESPGMPKKLPKTSGNWPEVLKAWRARRGLTQREAAELLGVPLSTFRRWEQGVSRPVFDSPSAVIEIVTNRHQTR